MADVPGPIHFFFWVQEASNSLLHSLHLIQLRIFFQGDDVAAALQRLKLTCLGQRTESLLRRLGVTVGVPDEAAEARRAEVEVTHEGVQTITPH